MGDVPRTGYPEIPAQWGKVVAITEPRKRFARREAPVWENNEESTKAHALNFMESPCERGKAPNADIETGHRSNSIALLGNIAMKTGKKLRWDAKKEDFVGASDASGLSGPEPSQTLGPDQAVDFVLTALTQELRSLKLGAADQKRAGQFLPRLG